MHELGTLDLFDHAGVDRLAHARDTAEQLGALSTAAVLDLQLAAGYHCRFELTDAQGHARSALALSERLGLDQVRPKALVMLAENAAWRGALDEMERYCGLTVAATDDPAMTAFLWGSRGMFQLLHGDRGRAVVGLARATAVLAQLPHAEPAAFRALWPVLLASVGDRRAAESIAEARRLSVDSFRLNSAILGGASAILTGQSGNVGEARRWVDDSAADFAACTAWAAVVRLLAAESAAAHGWDNPAWWVNDLAEQLAERGLARLAARCRVLAAGTQRWAGLGVTPREADVLSLVVEGLPNKEIAAHLGLSPRTVEKHVESLLRKLEVRSRGQLVSVAQRRAAT
jgi:DNA-binding CsgD family transcriptional regulator